MPWTCGSGTLRIATTAVGPHAVYAPDLPLGTPPMGQAFYTLRRYPQLMYRALVMFPKSASRAEVDALIEGIASSFTSSGSQPITRSVGSLMGPGAQGGEAGWILEADFATLEDALTALDAEDFRAMKAAVEAVTSAIFLFELGEA